MKASELRAKSNSDLHEQLEELHKTQFDMRMNKGMGQLGNTHEVSQVRRDIARIKTILNERRREQASDRQTEQA